MRKPWTPTDIALTGLSAIASGVIVLLLTAFVDASTDGLGVWRQIGVGLSWLCVGIGVLALLAAAVAKIIGVGVRSAND